MSAPYVLHDDATAVVIVVLEERLSGSGFADVPVRSLVPSPRPEMFVRVRRVGGVAEGLVLDGALVAVECYATGEDDAQDLAQVCRAILLASGGVHDAHQVVAVREASGPVPLPDPDSSQPRYTFTHQVWTRGTS